MGADHGCEILFLTLRAAAVKSISRTIAHLLSVIGEKYYRSFVLLFLSNYIRLIRYLLATRSVIYSVFYKVSPGKNNQGNTIFQHHLLLLRIMKRKQEPFRQSNILLLFLIGLFMITGSLST